MIRIKIIKGKRLTPAGGFTLIELLVVISIIAVLASIILASVDSAQKKAVQANVVVEMNSVENALQLYYNDHGDWPATANGQMVVSNAYVSGWGELENDLSPYISLGSFYNLPPILDANENLAQGYMYFKGTASNPAEVAISNSVTRAYVGCLKIYDGYYFYAIVSGAGQSSFTLNDGGIDPDGIDHAEGNYTVTPSIPPVSCPTTGIIE